MNNTIREWDLSHFDSRIRYSEVDEEGLLRADKIIDYFQDCSTFQSEDGGVGLRYMTDLGVAWIVNYWQIEIRRYPVLGEKVSTGTSPYRLRSFIGERNFIMEAEDGETLAVANSFWSLFDLRRMKPYPVTDKMMEVYKMHPPFDMDYKPRKIAIPGEPLTEAGNILIDGTHLDSNGHVNNAKYANSMPYYRLERDFLELGAEVSRQDMANWTIGPHRPVPAVVGGGPRLLQAHVGDGRRGGRASGRADRGRRGHGGAVGQLLAGCGRCLENHWQFSSAVMESCWKPPIVILESCWQIPID